MNKIAIIGSGPTGIYTLKGLLRSSAPLAITLYEAHADPGKGTPYHPHANDKAMLANIASIEIPPVCESLTQWLRRQSMDVLAGWGLTPDMIGERVFYPRIVLGDYYQAQLQQLSTQATMLGHHLIIKSSHRVIDIELYDQDIRIEAIQPDGVRHHHVFDHVVMATGHDWPDQTEVKPGFFISPWPAPNLETIDHGSIGILGTSLSGIDAVVSLATSYGSFLRDEHDVLQYYAHTNDKPFHLTMMSRKGLLPEADFYCPIPYEPLSIFTPAAVETLIKTSRNTLLDDIFALFQAQLLAADPDYAERLGLGMLSVETIADAYFAERDAADPFVWAALNLGEAKANEASKTTVAWRYAILRMHEVLLKAVPYFHDKDLKRFHTYFKTLFVDDYATVPHQSIERLLALHKAGLLSVQKLGPDYRLDTDTPDRGVIVEVNGQKYIFDAFIDATGQQAVSAWDVPFPSLIRQDVVRKAQTIKALTEYRQDNGIVTIATGGIDLDDAFRLKFEQPLSHNLYCVSIPFLLHKLPFVQGITSAEQMGQIVSSAIINAISSDVTVWQADVSHDHLGQTLVP